MAELKHNFTAGRMNKDLDERLVPNGEYRHALNAEVSVSENSDVGTLQTTMGNISHPIGNCQTYTPTSSAPVVFPSNEARCIGSITDDKNDKLYWFIVDPKAGVDMIVQYDLSAIGGGIRPVCVDPYWNGTPRALNFSSSYLITGINIIDDMLFWTDNNSEPKKINITRSLVGTTGWCACTKFLTKSFHDPVGPDLIANGNFITNADWHEFYPSYTNPPCTQPSAAPIQGPPWFIQSNTLVGNWGCAGYATYNFPVQLEPKKFYRLKYTVVQDSPTGGSLRMRGHDSGWPIAPNPGVEIPSTTGTHTFTFKQQSNPIHWSLDYLGLWLENEFSGTIDNISLTEVDPQLDPTIPSLTFPPDSPCIEEKHITVIKENPVIAPVLEMSQTPNRSSIDIAGILANITDFQADPNINVAPGLINDTRGLGAGFLGVQNGLFGWEGAFPNSVYPSGHERWYIFTGSPQFIVGDEILLTSNSDPTGERQVIATVIEVYGQVYGNKTKIKLRIDFIEESVDANDLGWTAVLFSETTSLFEFKFPRFATRYKYQDNEYSGFSPFTEIAFLPGRPNDKDFEYHPKQGFNLGMTNNLRWLALRGFVPEKDILPDGVIAIDILYKESNSPNVYVVKTITPGDIEWDSQIISGSISGARGYIRIKSEMIHAVLPENQLLRPWDNVPRKALSQEISGNRLIYGNYLQNYTVGPQNIEIGVQHFDMVARSGDIPEEIYPEFAYNYIPAKSIKTIRTYQLGIVYRDKYGRETPVITENQRVKLSGKASIYIEKEWSDWQNKITAQLHSPPPSFATTYKWFIKETSSEYYNLALDRWYNAQDHNIWLSFPSSERNKIDIETFLILKKEHDTNTFVHDDGRYKVLAIESEAPIFIKERDVFIGIMQDDKNNISPYTSTCTSCNIGTSTSGFPRKDTNIIWVDDEEMQQQGLYDMTTGELNIDKTKNLYIRITSVAGIASEWYYIQAMTHQTWVGNYWQFKVEGIFGDDMNFTSTGGTYATRIVGLEVEIRETVTEDRPEFEGRFFAKIHRDLTLNESLASAGPDMVNWAITREMSSVYVGPRFDAGYGNINPYNTVGPGGTSTSYPYPSNRRSPGQNNTNPNGWAEQTGFTGSGAINGWWGYNVEPDYCIPNGNEAWRFWTNFVPRLPNGTVDPANIHMIIDNAEHQPPVTHVDPNYTSMALAPVWDASSNSWILYGTWESGRNWNGIYACDSDTNGIGVHPCNDACHEHHYARTGGSYTTNVWTTVSNPPPNPAQRSAYWERTNGGTWGVSRSSQKITLSFAGTGTSNSSSQTCGHDHEGTGGGALGNNANGSWFKPWAVPMDPNQYLIEWDVAGNGIENGDYTAFSEYKSFLDDIRIPGTYWRWTEDPDQIIYKTVQGGQEDNILFNMRMRHSETRKDCITAGLICDPSSTQPSGDYIAYAAGDQSRLGRRHAFTFEAQTAFGPNMGQPPGNSGSGYLPTNDPRFIVGEPGFAWTGYGIPDTSTGCLAPADNCIPAPGFNPSGYAPGIRSDGVYDNQTPLQWNTACTWEIIEPAGMMGGSGQQIKYSSTNPAIFETEPKEDVGLNIYHEVGRTYPVTLDSSTNEMYIPVGSVVTCWRPGTGWILLGGAGANVVNTLTHTLIQSPAFPFGQSYWQTVPSGDPWIPPIKVRSCNNNTVTLVDAAGNLFVNNPGFPGEHVIVGDILVFIRPDGSKTESKVISPSPIGTSIYTLDPDIWQYKTTLPWFNCYSFGNGVESDRIRDDYNQVTIDNGPKASSTLTDPYEEERRGSGLIYSGIYNSISGINNLNQFIAAEKITKDLNPTYGTIQKLFSRNTNLVTLCEDKILKVLANKDAMYNADGNINVTSNLNVLGQSIPFVGDFGISKNPESFASESYRGYFSDKKRGAVLRLSQDGLTPISEFGMRDWFIDNLLKADRIVGTYDIKKQLYNITLAGAEIDPGGPYVPPTTPLIPINVDCLPNAPCQCTNPQLPLLPTDINQTQNWLGGYDTLYSGYSLSYQSLFWPPNQEVLSSPPSPPPNGVNTSRWAYWYAMHDNILQPSNQPTSQISDAQWTYIKEPMRNSYARNEHPWNVASTNERLDNSSGLGFAFSNTGVILRSNVQHLGGVNQDYIHEHNSNGIMCKVNDLCVGESYNLIIDYDGGFGSGKLWVGFHMQDETNPNPPALAWPVVNTSPPDASPEWPFVPAGHRDIPYMFMGTGGGGNPGTIVVPFTAIQKDNNLVVIDWHGLGNTDPNIFPCDQVVYSGSWVGISGVMGAWCDGTMSGFDPPIQELKITDVRMECVSSGCNCGCTEPLASNYDPLATCEDGSCVFTGPDVPPSLTGWFDYFATVSFSEHSKGWVSFKSFMPEDGLSLNNTYFTFKRGQLWEHHANPIRNNYYNNSNLDSAVTLLFNEAPETVKSFTTLNYEGSQSRITQDITSLSTGGQYDDVEYFDDVPKDGWYVDTIKTDLQTTGALEFKNKEGKWFSYPRGEATTWSNDASLSNDERGNIDPREFSYQGISNNCCRIINDGGVITETGTCCAGTCVNTTFNITSVIDATMDVIACIANADGEISITADSTGCSIWNLNLTYTGSGTLPPTTIMSYPTNVNGATVNVLGLIPGPYTLDIIYCTGGVGCLITTTVDVGSFCPTTSCGCTDPVATNYCPSCTCDDGSCIYATAGCTDPTATTCGGTPNTTPPCNGYDPAATVNDGSCCIVGCLDPLANNYIASANCIVTCTYDPSWMCSGASGAIDGGGNTIAPWNCYDPGNGTGGFTTSGACTPGCVPILGCIINQAVYNSSGSITFNYSITGWNAGDQLFYWVEDSSGSVLLGQASGPAVALNAASGTITTTTTLAGNGVVELNLQHITAGGLGSTCTWGNINTNPTPCLDPVLADHTFTNALQSPWNSTFQSSNPGHHVNNLLTTFPLLFTDLCPSTTEWKGFHSGWGSYPAVIIAPTILNPGLILHALITGTPPGTETVCGVYQRLDGLTIGQLYHINIEISGTTDDGILYVGNQIQDVYPVTGANPVGCNSPHRNPGETSYAFPLAALPPGSNSIISAQFTATTVNDNVVVLDWHSQNDADTTIEKVCITCGAGGPCL